MDFEELLIKYLANLDLKRVEYRVSKDFLSLLHDGLQDSMIDSINENVLGRHRNRLGKKLDLHKDLGIKDTRDRICSDHYIYGEHQLAITLVPFLTTQSAQIKQSRGRVALPASIQLQSNSGQGNEPWKANQILPIYRFPLLVSLPGLGVLN